MKLRAYEHKVNNIEVVVNLDQQIPSIFIDKNQMQQVFLNLVLNAESAMIESHNGGTLSIKTEISGESFRAIVSDNGPGIAAENVAHLFDPFFTTKPVGKGTGLGLSICYGIIKNHSGIIYAAGNEQGGASFHVDLPLKNGTSGGNHG